jgi:hypothetical protein
MVCELVLITYQWTNSTHFDQVIEILLNRITVDEMRTLKIVNFTALFGCYGLLAMVFEPSTSAIKRISVQSHREDIKYLV